MIYFYSGTPGSGKSLHVAKDIFQKLIKRKQNVIANFNINLPNKKKQGKFNFIDTFDMSPKFFVNYAEKYHVMGKENQTLVVIDECQVLFNPRSWNNKDRIDWINFFTQHRKFGFNFILISQFDRLVDRQIRALFEYDVKHRKVNNFKFMRFVPFIKIFICVTYWYGVNEKVDCEYFIFKKKYSNLYNTYKDFNKSEKFSYDDDIQQLM